jgi:hypothetical protein
LRVLHIDSILAIPVWGYIVWCVCVGGGGGCEGVYVPTCGECDLLWGPVIMVNYENGGGVCVFFGCHSGPVDGFYGCLVIRGVG